MAKKRTTTPATPTSPASPTSDSAVEQKVGPSSPPASAGTRRSRGAVDAPGKKHRKPAPSTRGAKHSDERIAKLRLANANRQRRSGGGR